MRLNPDGFNKLFTETFEGNYHEAARQLEVDAAQIHRIINKGTGAGITFIERLLNWCSKNQVDYNTLIFLPESLTIGNTTQQNE